MGDITFWGYIILLYRTYHTTYLLDSTTQYHLWWDRDYHLPMDHDQAITIIPLGSSRVRSQSPVDAFVAATSRVDFSNRLFTGDSCRSPHAPKWSTNMSSRRSRCLLREYRQQ